MQAPSITIDKKKKTVTVVLPLLPEKRLSTSGRSHIIADSGNFVKDESCKHEGKTAAFKGIVIIPTR